MNFFRYLTSWLPLSKVLGDNKFLFGDNPCDEDCCIFGFTTFILYNIPMNFYYGAMKEKFPNLVNSRSGTILILSLSLSLSLSSRLHLP